ncbi:CoA transferase [Aquabacter sp. CN5-332]|uniref:CaiB/BaiF CoA-transferase family protein n=1 Tax=Aquabacter sp. CN5-332 TaxID=3156608 RepID=UPI0032B3F501
MTLTTPFSDLVVLEWGRRDAVRACGSLLAQVGARVIVAGRMDPEDPFARFKAFVGDTPEARAAALADANIILFSSDRRDEARLPELRPDVIACDITVSGDPAHGAWSEALLQAATGIADITGTKDSPPTICEAPVIELQTGIFAAAGILAAWRQRAETGMGQAVGLSALDCGLNGLSSFLPLVFAGKSPKRSGNRHPMAVPWNSYRARDGWILLCSATDEHWVRLCALMGREELGRGAFEKLADRVAQCDAVDAEVEAWTRTLSVRDCIAALGGAGLAAGPILTLDGLKEDANLAHRGSISGGDRPLPLSFAKTAFPPDRPESAPAPRSSTDGRPGLPLAGMLVIEIGQYTTAPLAAKQLALLGAEVIKIEPPGGEASRAWPPHQDGQGYFFTMNNANKRSCLLDLRTDQGRDAFGRLVARADVLLENLKPGSLARLGFDEQTLQTLNPRLVYCAISGFGQSSAYPGRPAFDTVVQAMSGLMDVTWAKDVPVKLGISAADVTGGIAGLFAVLAGLEQRRRTGSGMAIDLAMQDIAVWLTQTAWNGAPRPAYSMLECADGFVVADRPATALGALDARAKGLSRDAVIAALDAQGISAAAVRTLAEIAADPGVVGDGAVAMFTGPDGRTWPLFRSPYRFSAMPSVPLAPIGPLGEANPYIEALCREPAIP